MTGADARRDEIGLRLFVAETRLIPDLAAHFLDDAVTGDGVTARRTDREDGLTECFEGLLPGDRGQLGGGARPRQRGEQLAAGGDGFGGNLGIGIMSVRVRHWPPRSPPMGVLSLKIRKGGGRSSR